MTEANPTRSVVVEREMPHPPDKVWRALTQGALIAEWLMQNDFEPVVGHKFNFRAAPMPPRWNGITDCEVLVVEPDQRLSYTWNSSGDEAGRLNTVVTWTLTPTGGGTLVRMEQSGFRPENDEFYRGAGYGWQKMVAGLERVTGGLA